MSVFTAVISSIAGTIILVALAALFWKIWKDVSGMLSALPKLVASIDKYISLEDHVKTIPVLLEGQAKMCAAQIAAIGELRKTVTAFKEAVFKRDNINSLELPSDGEKNLAWEAKRIKMENPGMDDLTAMMKAVESEMKDLNGASGVGEFSL